MICSRCHRYRPSFYKPCRCRRFEVSGEPVNFDPHDHRVIWAHDAEDAAERYYSTDDEYYEFADGNDYKARVVDENGHVSWFAVRGTPSIDWTTKEITDP